jgi:antitoxin (DNA-binding transcriptional repressor) of toxin-antitoxin stability system
MNQPWRMVARITALWQREKRQRQAQHERESTWEAQCDRVCPPESIRMQAREKNASDNNIP